MTTRSREWLRSFVNLGARLGIDGVVAEDVERQEDTVLRALHVLDGQPGVILADEVGMGKTFEALGLIAALRHRKPAARVLVITPGPDLNTKWKQEFERFSDPEHLMHDFGSDVAATTKLTDFASAAQCRRIVLVPISAFTSTRGGEDQAYLLSLFVHWLRDNGRAADGRTASAIMRRFRKGYLDPVGVRTHLFLGTFSFDQVSPRLQGVFGSQGEEGNNHGLYDLYRERGLAAFKDDERVRRALDLARFRLLRKLLPPFDLIVIDEAHKLKNASTVRYQAVTALLRKRFEKAVFLTATPFQLDISELEQIFRLFALARDAPESLLERAKALLDDVRSYQEAYTEFETVWRRLDGAAADRFATLYEADPQIASCPDDANLDVIARRLDKVRQLKEKCIQPDFQRWMIRSIRRDRRAYRRHKATPLFPSGEQALPFLVGERLIAELFRAGEGTHKPAAQVSLVSSFAAARRSAIVARGQREMRPSADEYRRLLRAVLRGASAVQHPKINAVLKEALDCAEHGEKTLVFCTRLATLSQMAALAHTQWLDRMVQRWKGVFPRTSRAEIFDEGEGARRIRGRHTLLQTRFSRSQDLLYLALRERHLASLGIAEWVSARESVVANRAQEILETMRVVRTSAARRDYRLAKRCIEQAAAMLWSEQTTRRGSSLDGGLLQAMTDERYVQLGPGRQADSDDQVERGTHRPQWRISAADVRLVAAGERSLWGRLGPDLASLQLRDRAALVEQVSRFLTFKEVPFLIELLGAAKANGLKVDPIASRKLLAYLDSFWDTTAGAAWLQRLREFVRYFASRGEAERRDILHGPIRTGEIVRQTKDGESRERLREAFNTPLYPMILLANEVMQEGLDLHRFCARVVHHDLEWNPAKLEQRVGRVDRIGSLIARRLQTDPSVTLEILYPLIDRTIDVRMYRSVKKREKWIEFLLGAPATVRADLTDDEDTVELPPALADALAIDLGPRHTT